MRRPLLIALAVVLVAVAAAGAVSYWRSTERLVTFTVEDKERVCDASSDGDGRSKISCTYLVFTSAGTFKITDTLLNGRFNSSDDYGRIRRGHRYQATVRGWRFGLFDMYPNMIKYRELPR